MFKRLWRKFRNLFRKRKVITVTPNMGEKPTQKMSPMNWAEGEMGVREIYGRKHNPRVLFYHGFTSLDAADDETPWCSSFVCAVMESCGFDSTRSARARSWEDYGEKGEGKRGDIVVFSRGNNPSSGHVGFVAKDYKPGDSYISVLGGNQSNSVCITEYPVSRLVSFRKY